MAQRGQDINLPLETEYDRIAARAREYDQIAAKAREAGQPKPPPQPQKPSEDPVMAFASGAGVQPFGEHGLMATGKGMINLMGKTAQLPPGQQSASMTMTGGSAIFNSILAPLLKLTKPENRAAVAQTILTGLSNPSMLGVNAPTTLRALETVPVLGPGYGEARRRIETGDPWGGLAYAAGNTATLAAGTPPTKLSNAAIRLVGAATKPIERGAIGLTRAILHGAEPGSAIPTRAAAGTNLEEGFLRFGIQAGQRKAAEVEAKVAEEVKRLTDYGAINAPPGAKPPVQNPTVAEVAARNRNVGIEAGAEAGDLEQRTARQIPGSEVGPDFEAPDIRNARTQQQQFAASNLGLQPGAEGAPSALAESWRAILPERVQGSRPAYGFTTGAGSPEAASMEALLPSALRRPGALPPARPTVPPSAPPPAAAPSGVSFNPGTFIEPVPPSPMMRPGAGGIAPRNLPGPQGTPQFFPGQGIEGPNVQGLFKPGQLQPAQQPFAREAVLELLEAQGGQPLTKREGVNVIGMLRREPIEKPLEAPTARTMARDAQAADLARELAIDTPAAREAIDRLGSVNAARRLLARSKAANPLSFQLPWYVRAGYALGAPATQLGYDVGYRLPNMVAPSAGEAFRAALLARLGPQGEQKK
jgi:hypothetical protein